MSNQIFPVVFVAMAAGLAPDILGGEPVFRGTRIPLQHVAVTVSEGRA
jgi:uncharacterized protein (DUF433 family)